nr:DUF2794 domain-containing protein [Aureimonas sp. Leaf460]
MDFPSARHPPAPAPSSAAAHGIVAFDRRELNEILNIYGRMVAAGEWRDYAIDMLKDRAVFSIFRRTSEMPLFRVEKTPRLARRQGAFSVTAAGGLVMKRGHELGQVLKVFDKALRSVEER